MRLFETSKDGIVGPEFKKALESLAQLKQSDSCFCKAELDFVSLGYFCSGICSFVFMDIIHCRLSVRRYVTSALLTYSMCCPWGSIPMLLCCPSISPARGSSLFFESIFIMLLCLSSRLCSSHFLSRSTGAYIICGNIYCISVNHVPTFSGDYHLLTIYQEGCIKLSRCNCGIFCRPSVNLLRI